MTKALLKDLFALQLDRAMKVAPLASMGMLLATLTLLVTEKLLWRFDNYYLTIAVTGFFLLVFIILIANLWAKAWDMLRAMRRSNAIHDLTQVSVLTPWERIIWRNAMLPQLRNQRDISDKLEVPHTLDTLIEKLERWEQLGYIPKSEYPDDLIGYYFKEGKL